MDSHNLPLAGPDPKIDDYGALSYYNKVIVLRLSEFLELSSLFNSFRYPERLAVIYMSSVEFQAFLSNISDYAAVHYHDNYIAYSRGGYMYRIYEADFLKEEARILGYPVIFDLSKLVSI